MRSGSKVQSWAVVAIALGAVLMRLPYLVAPESIDEGGYLAVARQWHGAGTSLYTNLWVDRPPLLITIFQVGAWLGGLTQLRIMAAIGVGIAVLGAAAVSRRVAGPQAAIWTAAVAAVLFSSPRLGTVQVNGEILAAPFVAWAMVLCVIAIQSRQGTAGEVEDDERAESRGIWAAFGAGLLAVTAVLVKQNMVDPAVFGVVAGVAAWVAARRVSTGSTTGAGTATGGGVSTGSTTGAEAATGGGVSTGSTTGAGTAGHLRLAMAAAAGSAVMLLVVGGWTLLHGTSLHGVFDAMYPFRLRSGRLLATFPDSKEHLRKVWLLKAGLRSVMYLTVVGLAWTVVRKRIGGPFVWGLGATLAWGLFSVVRGGGFWNHYLIELVVPVAIAAGLAFGSRETAARRTQWVPALTATVVIVAAVVNWAGALGMSETSRGSVIGQAIGAASQPGDTLVSVFGLAQTNEEAGLPSPYPYLWSLTARVQDPHLTQLIALLEGPSRPTWYVQWSRPHFPLRDWEQLTGLVGSLYHPAGVVCGKTIYLRDDVVRPVPRATTTCTAKDAVAAPGYGVRMGVNS